MNRLLVFVFLLMNGCFFSTTYAQDTLSLFYGTANYRLTEDHQTQLNHFMELHDMGLVDSIQIIGVADSSGNSTSNLRLSLRRASHVESFFQHHSVETKIIVLAKGEDPNSESMLQIQRRVDIIFFFPLSNTDDSIPTEIEELGDSSCYIKADFILNHCFQTIIQKGRKAYVQLEMDPAHYAESMRVFSVHEDEKAGTPILRLVKWKATVSGEDWWSKKRYIATVKQEDFDRFTLVEKLDKPCDSSTNTCGFKLTDKYIQLGYRSYLDLAYFLMENAKVKKTLFNRKKTRIEVPKVYVGNEQYYLDSQGKVPVEWYTKRGRRHRSSYFADVYSNSRRKQKITIYKYFHVSRCYEYTILDCLSETNCLLRGSAFFGVEMGDRMLTLNHFGYLGMVGKYTFRSCELDLLLGIDTKWDPFASIRYDYHFIGLNQTGFIRKPLVYSQNMLGLFGGTTLDVIAQDAKRLLANQDLHVGIDFTFSYVKKPFHRIYIEAGPMMNYSNPSEPITLQYRFGIQFKF